MRKGHRGGGGHQTRRDAARSETRLPTRADSTDPRYWPAPRWTHDMADEAAAANDRRYAAAQHGAYLPPAREPVTEAWGELAAQRGAETVHRLDLALAREQMRQAAQQAVAATRQPAGRGRGVAPLVPQAWAAVRAAARKASCSAQIQSPEPGATRALGPDAPRPLALVARP